MRAREMMALVLALAGCATAPSGPEVLVLPGTGRTFDEFRQDDQVCRAYAWQQIGGAGGAEAADQRAIGAAAVGTAVGAVAGAAIGGRDSAGIGAGMGLVIGSVGSMETTRRATAASQRQYDHAYVQCMYAKGHRVPVGGVYSSAPPEPAKATHIPPPPPGSPPPPPPR